MEVDGDDIPLCTSCGHRHIQGVKCHICGHVGKSQIYQKMRIRAKEKRAIRSIIYDGSEFNECLDDWDVIMELRKKVFCIENSIPIDQEFNEVLEKASKHLICYAGDAPTAFARYRVLSNTEGAIFAQIDRLGVLTQYRGRKFTRKCIEDILADAQVVTNNSISALLIAVPCESWMKVKLESLGWRHYESKPIELRGQQPYLEMVFYAQQL
mmetsp:Transcript_30373/g.29022  ORF Transcript_30373/g.29022 Transcript_30373/m.29022 type:complete len:211 (+) Transcript_30373:198-830(+)